MSMFSLTDEMMPGFGKDNPLGAFKPLMNEMQKSTEETMAFFGVDASALPKTMMAEADFMKPSVEAALASTTFPMAVAAHWYGVMTGGMDGAQMALSRMAGMRVDPMAMWSLATTSPFAPVADEGPKAPKTAKAETAAAPAAKAKKPAAAKAPAAPAPAPVSDAVTPKTVSKAATTAATNAKSAQKSAAKGSVQPKVEENPEVPVEVKDTAASIIAAPVVTEAAPTAPSAPAAPSASTVQPEDFIKPKGIEKPAAPDDLKLISGIGPKLEGLLNKLGVWTFAQIAAWSPNEIAWVDDYLQFKGRIERDNWIGQADALAAGGVAEYLERFGKEPR